MACTHLSTETRVAASVLGPGAGGVLREVVSMACTHLSTETRVAASVLEPGAGGVLREVVRRAGASC